MPSGGFDFFQGWWIDKEFLLVKKKKNVKRGWRNGGKTLQKNAMTSRIIIRYCHRSGILGTYIA